MKKKYWIEFWRGFLQMGRSKFQNKNSTKDRGSQSFKSKFSKKNNPTNASSNDKQLAAAMKRVTKTGRSHPTEENARLGDAEQGDVNPNSKISREIQKEFEAHDARERAAKISKIRNQERAIQYAQGFGLARPTFFFSRHKELRGKNVHGDVNTYINRLLDGGSTGIQIKQKKNKVSTNDRSAPNKDSSNQKSNSVNAKKIIGIYNNNPFQALMDDSDDDSDGEIMNDPEGEEGGEEEEEEEEEKAKTENKGPIISGGKIKFAPAKLVLHKPS